MSTRSERRSGGDESGGDSAITVGRQQRRAPEFALGLAVHVALKGPAHLLFVHRLQRGRLRRAPRRRLRAAIIPAATTTDGGLATPTAAAVAKAGDSARRLAATSWHTSRRLNGRRQTVGEDCSNRVLAASPSCDGVRQRRRRHPCRPLSLDHGDGIGAPRLSLCGLGFRTSILFG